MVRLIKMLEEAEELINFIPVEEELDRCRLQYEEKKVLPALPGAKVAVKRRIMLKVSPLYPDIIISAMATNEALTSPAD
jgi:hypothetical protein